VVRKLRSSRDRTSGKGKQHMEDERMENTDWAILARFGIAPDHLTVGGSLYLSGTGITALPDNLTVGRSLDLRDTGITALPDNLTVGGSLYLSGTGITALHIDERGYRLDRAGKHYHAGCRRFTRAEALAHWGSPDYPDPERGAGFVAAINATVEAK
jgi:hypothetical protein